MYFSHQQFGVCEHLKGGKMFRSLADGDTHIFNASVDGAMCRPIASRVDVSAGAHITAQALRGEILSFGGYPENRQMSWMRLRKQNTFLGLCQIVGEIVWLQKQNIARCEDLALKDKLENFVKTEIALIEREKNEKL